MKYLHISTKVELELCKLHESRLVESGCKILNCLGKNIDDSLTKFEIVNFHNIKKGESLRPSDVDYLSQGINLVGLWERGVGWHKKANYHRAIYDITLIHEKVKSAISEYSINTLYIAMIPHSVIDYLLALEVEKSGGSVIYLSPSFLPWAQCIWQGISERKRIKPVGYNYEQLNSLKQKKFNGRDITSGQLLLIEQEKKYKLNFKKMLSVSNILRGLIILLWKIEKRSNERALSDKSIVAYLHYQPEATNNPFFGNLTQQFFLLKPLKISYNRRIFVREHPNQLIEAPPFRSSARWFGFYKKLCNDYNLKITSNAISLQEMLEKNCHIFSIAGSVLFEYGSLGGSIIFPVSSPIFDKHEILSTFGDNICEAGLFVKLEGKTFETLTKIELNMTITTKDDKLDHTTEDRVNNLIDFIVESSNATDNVEKKQT